jgi:RNA recognition motif-containing protein
MSVLRLEGLPFRVTEDEITDFFAESEAKVERVYLMLNRNMRPSGTAYVDFESDADAKLAVALDGKCIGDSKRYVKIGQLNFLILF